MLFKVQHLAAAALPALAYAAPSAPLHTSLNPRSLQKRSMTNVACGFYSTASSGDGMTNANTLRYKEGEVTIPPKSCGRIGCYNTSGTYVCNDGDSDITVPLEAAGLASYVLWDTCSTGDGYSGQGFYDDQFGQYNIVVGFCDTSKDGTIPPSDYIPFGPNGDPGRKCGGDSGVSCTVGSCDDSTIRMTAQDDITCGLYMSGGVGAPGVNTQYSTTRNIGESWTVGFDLGLSVEKLLGLSLGFSTSYTSTIETGSVQGVEEVCGSNNDTDGVDNIYSCGMLVDPACFKMTGTCHATLLDDEQMPIDLGDVPWEVITPKTADNGQSAWTADLCVCPNCPGTDDPDLPADICPLPCDDCKTEF